MIMRIKKLKFKKEIVANLSDAESKQIRGGQSEHTGCSFQICPTIHGSCLCGGGSDGGTSCCGPTYCDCSQGC